MALTAAQLTALKADIQANTDPGVVQAIIDGAFNVVADWYNQDAAPDYYVYKTLVPLSEVSAAIELDDVANITTADSDRLIKFYHLRPDGVFASKATDRAGFDDVFSSAAGDDSQQALIALWKRLANNVEKLFGTGAGVGSTADPDTMGYEGTISPEDVNNAILNG